MESSHFLSTIFSIPNSKVSPNSKILWFYIILIHKSLVYEMDKLKIDKLQIIHNSRMTALLVSFKKYSFL